MTQRYVLAGAVAALLLASGAFAPPVHAQTGKLTGLVTDQQTGEPLAGVQVTIEELRRSTLTGENGRYFMINIPPGTYTVTAQIIGYATVRKENISITIDVTRTVDFEMTSEALAVSPVVVEVERVPLIETSAAGSSSTLTTAEVNTLPVTSVEGALALKQGFLQVPQNTDIIAFTDTRRNPIEPLQIRGGRVGETLTLIDGIPVNNFVFGGPAITINRKYVQQIEYQRGGLEPQYGNALSGIVNVATKEGSRELEGSFEYQTSSLGGALGNRHDELLGYSLFEGHLSGPVPGTGERLRFVIAGRNKYSADQVHEYDNDVFRPDRPPQGLNTPHPLDVIAGWRADGYDSEGDLFAKLTFEASPTAKLSFSVLDYYRQRMPFDFAYLLTGFNPSDECVKLGVDRDVCDAYYGTAGQTPQGYGRYEFIARSSIRLDRRLYTLKWDHTLNRTRYTLAAGLFDQERLTCNYLDGVCLEDRFADTNFTGRFVAPGITAFHPAAGTDEFYGGEKLRTLVARADVESQITDHHNIQAGVYYERHDLDYHEVRNRGTNDVIAVPTDYTAKPWNAAFYVQDEIEYDFVTVRLGFRFDYGRAGGLFFADPLDPTNGTTARDVCENPLAFQNVRVRVPNESGTGTRVVQMSADPSWTWEYCSHPDNRDVLAEAARIASHDDFGESSLRKQFSPRIQLSFPVTETSNFFFNFGRYSQNPLLNNIYQGTGIGTPLEGVPGGPRIFSTSYTIDWIGNPHLLVERTDAYEIGFQAAINDEYSFQTVFFTKDQFGLTGLQEGGRNVTDPGATYGTNIPRYWVLVNKDFQTVRGFEIGVQRRLSGYWGFDLNYTFSRATTNAAAPEREAQGVIEEGDPQARIEFPSPIDRPHVFNGVLRFQVGRETPDIPFGNWLRHTMAAVTIRAASGFPYTPTTTFTGIGENAQLARNSARAPATFQLDLLARKEWEVGNLRYGVFARVVNLTDRINCVQVYVSSGNCIAGTVDQNRERHGNTVGEGANSTYFDRPYYIGERRSINAGVTINF